MTAKSALMERPPAPVVEALARLGSNLKKARLRRNLSEQDIATKVGVTRKVIADAERGKLSTSAAVYVAMLWALGLDAELAHLADPSKDDVGRMGELLGKRTRAGKTGSDVGFF